jgi:hypothetical protein
MRPSSGPRIVTTHSPLLRFLPVSLNVLLVFVLGVLPWRPQLVNTAAPRQQLFQEILGTLPF